MIASSPSTCGRLESLLFGSPVRDRRNGWDTVADQLDGLVLGIADLLEAKMGSSDAVQQAVFEWRKITKLDKDYFGVACRRGALMFALYQEADVRAHFTGKGEDAFVTELCEGVLPLVVPPYVGAFLQNPDRLVVAASVVWSMWGSSDLRAVTCD